MNARHAVLALICLAHVAHANTVTDLYAACSAGLGIPQVALLFLATNDLHFRPMWRTWLLGARGMLPIPQIYRAATAGPDLSASEQRVQRALEACRAIGSDAKPAYQQVRTISTRVFHTVFHSICSPFTCTRGPTLPMKRTACFQTRSCCPPVCRPAGDKPASSLPRGCCWSAPCGYACGV